MSKTKIIVVTVMGALVLAVVYFGLGRYRDYRRNCADRCAAECLREYAKIIGNGQNRVSAETLGPTMKKMEELSETCSGAVAEMLFARRLDGAFLTGDYALAERMMDDLPEKSTNWKEGAKAKIRAHAALERGDKTAAIGEFETFCRTLLQEPPDAVEYDPCSGIEWSREGLLARNLTRMSGLAAETGDKVRAEKFMSDARSYAKTALKKAEGDSEAVAALSAEFAELLK